MTEDIIFRIVDLPHSIKATVSPSPDGCYNVYINARLNAEQQQLAAEHELRHILAGHFDRNSSVAMDELEAEGIIQYRKARQQIYLPPQPLPVAPPPVEYKPQKEKPKFPFSQDKPAYLYHLAKWAGVSQDYIINTLGISKSDYNEYRFYNNKCPAHIRKAVERLIAKKVEGK